ncbi:MAG: phage tail protein [Gammaproteobacteria bacterium]|nr:phage tail protein [Gammaproteobacteria bacterium]
MATKKLEALTAFLLDKDMVSANQFDSWMQDGELQMSGKNQGHGLLIFRLNYNAFFSIEEYTGNADTLCVHVVTWLMDNDPCRDRDELPNPSIDVDVGANGVADVEISINFIEDVEMVEDPDGDITFNGKTWSIGEVEISVVDEIAVGDNTELPPDLVYVHES